MSPIFVGSYASQASLLHVRSVGYCVLIRQVLADQLAALIHDLLTRQN